MKDTESCLVYANPREYQTRVTSSTSGIKTYAGPKSRRGVIREVSVLYNQSEHIPTGRLGAHKERRSLSATQHSATSHCNKMAPLYAFSTSPRKETILTRGRPPASSVQCVLLDVLEGDW